MGGRRRRDLLRVAGTAAAVGLAGCLFGGGGSGGASDGTYDLVATNEITVADLEAAPDFDSSKTAVVSIEVDRVREGDNEVLFERTVELGPEESRTFEDAFETDEEDSAYAINVELEPFYDGPQQPGDTRDGLRFVPGEPAAPDDDSVEVRVVDEERDDFLVPSVRIEDTYGQG